MSEALVKSLNNEQKQMGTAKMVDVIRSIFFVRHVAEIAP